MTASCQYRSARGVQTVREACESHSELSSLAIECVGKSRRKPRQTVAQVVNPDGRRAKSQLQFPGLAPAIDDDLIDPVLKRGLEIQQSLPGPLDEFARMLRPVGEIVDGFAPR